MTSSIKRLISEAHRRSVWKVLGVYVVGAATAWQMVAEITDRVGLPEWVPIFALILLIIGLPIVIATAVVQEGSPLARTPEQPAAQPSDPTLTPVEQNQAGTPPSAPTPPKGIAIDYGKHHWIFTWPRAIAAGLIAFVLLGITAGGYMGMRNAGIGPFGSLLAKGAIEHREPIIIADFHSASGDTALAQAITEAFRVDFTQTQTVTVVEPTHVRLVLQRMSHDPKAKLDADLARDVAIRDNVKVLVTGEVSAAGGRYVVAARIVNAKDATVLASFRETAADSTMILNAVDKLSKKLREKLGESLKTVRAEKPLEAVSTPSLDALLKYTQASYALDTQGDFEAGISLLEEALAIDSMFGMAWRKLGVAYANSGSGREKVVNAATKAYQYQDRMTDVEKYHAVGYYHYSVKNDMNKAISAYELLADRDPNWPPNNLGLAYQRTKQNDKAVAAFREAIRRDSTLQVGWSNLGNLLRTMQRLPEAEQVLQGFARRFPDATIEVKFGESSIAMTRGDYAAAEAKIREAAKITRNPLWRARTAGQLGTYAQLRGQLSEAERLYEESAAAQVERGNDWATLNRALGRASLSRQLRLDPERARRELADALAKYPLDKYPVLQRPYVGIAWQYASLGDEQKAKEYLAAYEHNVPADMRGPERQYRNMVDGLNAVAEKRWNDALAVGRREFDDDTCEVCWAFNQAYGFDQAQQLDSALVYYEKSVSHPGWSADNLAWTRPRAHERLAELHDARGDRDKAAFHAAKFISFWEKADAELAGPRAGQTGHAAATRAR